MLNKKIIDIIQSKEIEMIEFRRHLYMNPELSMQEFLTSEKIIKKLEEFQIPCRKIHPTGVIADIKGNKPGKTIALRADIDALPVQELNQLKYSSQKNGIKHACGHDAHTAMLITAAYALNEIKDELQGNIRLIFQPAEEIGIGAKFMIDQNAIQNCDSVFGIHIWSNMENGKASCEIGPSFAGADTFKINFKGKGGHGAIPHQTIDAIMMAATFTLNVQTIVSRSIDPLESAVITIGMIDSGTASNIIAETAYIEGTARFFSMDNRDLMMNKIKLYANSIAKMYGGSVEIEYIKETQPVINDEKSSILAQKLIKEMLGDDNYVKSKPTTGAEDFCFYLDHIPGCFALIGCANKELDTCWPHHHGKFNIDESSMINGVNLYAQYAFNYLNN